MRADSGRPAEWALDHHHAAETVDAVRLWVDDPDGFMSAVRTHIP